MSFGSTLKQAREALGLSTQELSVRTKIRGDYLRALEEGNTALLPERTFARSYLQRYARELNLDPTPLIAEFDRSVPPTPEVAQSLRGTSTPAQATSGVSPAMLAGLLTAVIVLGAGGYYAFVSSRPTPVAAAPVSETTPTQTAPAQATPAATPPAAPASTTVRLTIKSVPSGARVYLDNRDLGTTPLTAFPVDRRDRAELRMELSGRQPLKQTVVLSQSRNLCATLPATGTGRSALTDLNRPGSAPTLTPASATPAAAASTSTPASPRSAVNVTFAAPSWTRVTGPGGVILYQGTPPAGSVKGFPAGVTIRAGNAGGVRVSVNGAAAQPMGQNGQVVTRSY